jgi:hypothetical protein
LPRQYRVVLHGKPVRCPSATGRPATWPTSDEYAVSYDITPSGTCIIASRGPLP